MFQFLHTGINTGSDVIMRREAQSARPTILKDEESNDTNRIISNDAAIFKIRNLLLNPAFWIPATTPSKLENVAPLPLI